MSGDTASPPVIETRAVVKSFAGVQALRGVDLTVRAGEIHALLGQNGAGKSTLVKILNGVHPAGSFSGDIRVAGRPVSFRSTSDARAEGVGYVPQEIEVLEQLTVAENVFAGQTGLGAGVLVSQRRLEERTRALFAEIGLAIDPRALVASLTAAQRHLVMIARALSFRPRVLMLDEPTASLSGVEVERLFAVLRRLKAQGSTMIFITHRLPEVLAICDRATVLRDGRVAAEIGREAFDAERFIFAMSGQRLQRLYPHHEPPPPAPPLLSVRNLTIAGRFGVNRGVSDVGFDVRPGEILGLAGLLGSGRTEILHAIYGRIPFAGEIAIAGRPVTIRKAGDARAAGIALLTEDRKRDGLLFNLPVGANITIGNLGPLASRGIVSDRKEKSAVLAAMRSLAVKARSPQSSVAHLSGGNQQKLLFARVLMSGPRVLLLDEPTKGVDASTRHEIYRLIVDLAEKGVALVVVASELEEIIGIADRCLVVADGRIVDEFKRGEGSEDRVLRAVAAAQAAATMATALPASGRIG
ncbi:sugar ABC transporter ATP-binding protein [Kaistia geumhonensis]|uniref:ABC-type sugar transport system ATPase subunit n=1 Tax=Kaistia geumhonensis TaxID=410839 RepID=A0ABU0M8D5_9HYPH|nr:sugar ABC transporter ATP-binding protein [Kaistia geumhonensis]MCX5477556.1 sugar ABC transporter ATP-binding protein [Kaistia geumhonensis]MDQ0517237.1 ABC-type sugar transport system ATPase subunit [Kaistia geumhonensis]